MLRSINRRLVQGLDGETTLALSIDQQNFNMTVKRYDYGNFRPVTRFSRMSPDAGHCAWLARLPAGGMNVHPAVQAAKSTHLLDEVVCLAFGAGWLCIESGEQSLTCLLDRFDDQAEPSWQRA